MSDPDKIPVSLKIRRKLRFFTVMFFIFLSLSFYYFTKEQVPVKYPVLVFIIGVFLGALLSRIQNVTWDKHGEQIVKEFDIISGILLFFLILSILFKKEILHEFIHLQQLSAIIFALNSGIMLGRILRIRHKIKKILLEKNRY